MENFEDILPLVALVIALIQWCKEVFPSVHPRLAGMVAGLAIAFLHRLQVNTVWNLGQVIETIFFGLIIALTAMGLFDSAREIYKKNKVINEKDV